jgi:hypothetical protein
MARMSLGGRGFAGPVAGSRRRGGALASGGDRLGSLPGRVAPGRAARRRSGGFASQPLGGADLAPYRHRAARLADLLASDRPLPKLGDPGDVRDPGELGRRLGLVRVGVDALVADLGSVDAVEEAMGPLRELAVALLPLARPGVPERGELEQLRDLALAVLRAFAAPDGQAGHRDPLPPTGGGRTRDQGFWKR